MKDHIRVQLAVAPGAEAEVAPRLPPGRYRMRIEGEQRYGYLDVGPGDGGASRGGPATAPAEVATAGPPALRLVNDTSELADVRGRGRRSGPTSRSGPAACSASRTSATSTTRSTWAPTSSSRSASRRSCSPTWSGRPRCTRPAATRRRSSRSAATSSTSSPMIGQHRGAVVKTIGDAAMGAFNDPLDAVKAAAAIQRAFHPDRADTAGPAADLAQHRAVHRGPAQHRHRLLRPHRQRRGQAPGPGRGLAESR